MAVQPEHEGDLMFEVGEELDALPTPSPEEAAGVEKLPRPR